MVTVPKRPLGVTLTSTDVPDHAAWLAALRAVIDDALAAGEDATRRLSERVLSRAEARRKLQEADVRIAALFEIERRCAIGLRQQQGKSVS